MGNSGIWTEARHLSFGSTGALLGNMATPAVDDGVITIGSQDDDEPSHSGGSWDSPGVQAWLFHDDVRNGFSHKDLRYAIERSKAEWTYDKETWVVIEVSAMDAHAGGNGSCGARCTPPHRAAGGGGRAHRRTRSECGAPQISLAP